LSREQKAESRKQRAESREQKAETSSEPSSKCFDLLLLELLEHPPCLIPDESLKCIPPTQPSSKKWKKKVRDKRVTRKIKPSHNFMARCMLM